MIGNSWTFTYIINRTSKYGHHDFFAVTQAKTFIDNIFFNEATFISDADLQDELIGKHATAASVGLTLISRNGICCVCSFKLTVRIILVL